MLAGFCDKLHNNRLHKLANIQPIVPYSIGFLIDYLGWLFGSFVPRIG